VSQFDVGAGGLLAAKSPATVPAGTNPAGVAVSPDGRGVYVTNGGSDNVSQYDVGTGGVLVPKTPTAVTAGDSPLGIALSPNQGPIAAFSASVAAAGSATGFDGSASSDSDGSVARYDWDFGDGTGALDGGPTPTHAYAAAGDYTVTLTVTDDGGCSMSFVFTGQTAHCTGGAAARTSNTITVPSPPSPPTPDPTPTPTPTDGGGDTMPTSNPPPKASFAGSKSSITVRRDRRFKFSFRATPGLKGRAVFKSVNKVRVSLKRRVTLARKSFTVPAGGKVTLRLRLSKKKFRILKRSGKIRTRVTVTLVNSAGLTSTARKTVLLKAPG
jgi:YVTN family beta-propeller protein